MSGFDKAARTLRKDLLAAGLPLEDADGHPIDFHSLRATFGDLLIQQGVPIPTVARLMRHSDGGALLLKRYTVGSSETVLAIICDADLERNACCPAVPHHHKQQRTKRNPKNLPHLAPLIAQKRPALSK